MKYIGINPTLKVELVLILGIYMTKTGIPLELFHEELIS